MRLLLHICCGPCALYPITKLREDRFREVVGFYYNPNIHPNAEYKRRKRALAGARRSLDFRVIYPPYSMEEYFTKVAKKEDTPSRCRSCWELRLSRTADFARENKFDMFTTTLLISPYQDHELVKEIGIGVGHKKGIEFYYEDFRKGFRGSQEEAKKQGIYRQRYCGCVFSELERTRKS